MKSKHTKCEFHKVAVLMGGQSAEREISLLSGQGVLGALRSQGVNAHAFDPALENIGLLKSQGFDACFIALHGRYGEDGTVQGALELQGIPYTGSGVMASAMAIDKVMTKRVWMAQGLPTPKFVLMQKAIVSTTEAEEIADELGFPIIVKPAREGSSLGVEKVMDVHALKDAVAKAARMDSAVLCEECIIGEEVTCPVLGSGDSAQALPLIRIVAPEGNYDYENKYFKDETEYLIPCGLPDGEEERIQRLILKAYRVLGCRGWGRVDVMIDAKRREPYLLEVNTSPGMTSHSLVPKSAKAIGLSYEELCVELLCTAANDYEFTKVR
jgi:D-alanine-D-alanine ligase